MSEPNGELMDFARDTLFDFSRVKDPPRRPSWEQPGPTSALLWSRLLPIASAAEVSELLRSESPPSAPFPRVAAPASLGSSPAEPATRPRRRPTPG